MRRCGLIAFCLLAIIPLLARADEDAAVAALKQLRAKVVRDDKAPGKPVVEVDLRGTDAENADLAPLQELKSLRILDVRGTQVTGGGLKVLEGLKNIELVRLSEEQTNDKALKTLRDIGMLHALSCAADKDGKRPKNAAEVQSLDLSKCHITGAGIAELADLKNLQALNLTDSLAIDRHLQDLRVLKSLNTLTLGRHQVTFTGLKNLQENGQLHALWCAGAKDGKRPRGPEEVTTLNLRGIKISADLVGIFRAFRNLNDLLLDNDDLTDASLRNLREAGMLHALSWCVGEGGKRPNGPQDVHYVMLRKTKASSKAFTEFKDFKNLRRIDTGHAIGVKELQEMGLLHTMRYFNDKDGKTPARPEDVASADLRHGGASELVEFLKQCKNLERLHINDPWFEARKVLGEMKKLRELHAYYGTVSHQLQEGSVKTLMEIKKQLPEVEIRIHSEEFTAHALKGFAEHNAWAICPWAKGEGGKRPTNAAEVVELNLGVHGGFGVGGGDLKYLKGMDNLRVLNLGHLRYVRGAVQHLKELPKLESLDLTRIGRDGSKLVESFAALENLKELGLKMVEVRDEEAAPLKTLKRLERLDLSHSPYYFTDKALVHLKELPELRALRLAHTQVTGKGLKELKGLTKLEELDLSWTRISTPDLKELKHLPIKKLVLQKVSVPINGLDVLKDFKDLEYLDLQEDNVTDQELRAISKLTKLKYLDLTKVFCKAGFGRDAMAALRDLESLEFLDADRTLVGDAGLRDVGRLKNLRSLNLMETQITGAGLSELKDLKKLETLFLTRKQMTDDAIKALREVGQLHAYYDATTLDGKRPATDDDIGILDLGGCHITEAALDELKHLKGLRVLHVYNTQISPEGFKKLADLPTLAEVLVGYNNQKLGDAVEHLWRSRPELRIVEDGRVGLGRR